MNRLTLASSVGLLLATSAAFADPGGHGNAKHGNPYGNTVERADHHRHGHDQDGHRYDARHAQNWKAAGRHDNGLHLGQRRHAWQRGQRLPTNYLQSRYYVNNYAAYHLSPPPPGYRWVRPYQDNNRYYLVQNVTGLISRIFGGP